MLELLGWIASEEDELGNGSPTTRATRGGKKRSVCEWEAVSQLEIQQCLGRAAPARNGSRWDGDILCLA